MSAVKRSGGTRREKAAATRERMLRAAIEVFAEEGYVGARMADIAARAGVAVQTVYFVFHTKPELLQACFDYAVLGPERLVPAGPGPVPRDRDGALRAGRAPGVRRRQHRDPRAGGDDRRGGASRPARARGGRGRHEQRAAPARRLPRVAGDHRRAVPTASRSGARGRDRHPADVRRAARPTSRWCGAGWSRERFEEWLTDTLARTLLARTRSSPSGTAARPPRSPRPRSRAGSPSAPARPTAPRRGPSRRASRR